MQCLFVTYLLLKDKVYFTAFWGMQHVPIAVSQSMPLGAVTTGMCEHQGLNCVGVSAKKLVRLWLCALNWQVFYFYPSSNCLNLNHLND